MPILDVQKRTSKNGLHLKPIQPTQFWTFDNALSLFISCQDPYILDALDVFLLLNSELILKASPFEVSENTTVRKDTKEITLRNILYSDITPDNIEDAKKISQLLNLDYREVIRIIVQTCKKVPQRRVYDFSKLKSKLPDDREKYLEEERILLYSSKILKERRNILKLVIELLNNKMNTNISSTIQNLGKEIFLSKTYINDLIASLDKLFNALTSKSYEIDFSEKLNELVYIEVILLIVDSMKVLVELLVQNPNITTDIVLNWFMLMNKTNFIFNLGPFIKHHETFASLQSLATIITIVLLDLENCHTYQEPSHFFNDIEPFTSMNETIISPANKNSIIMYSWSIILLRKYYILTESNEANIFNLQFEEIINDLNTRCIKLKVFQELRKINNLLKFDNIYPAILSTVILSAMPLISLTPEIATTIEMILKNSPNSVIERFFANESTQNAIILSRAKFPLLLTPYLKLASINGNFALGEFNELKSYISIFKKEEFNKLYEIDDENTELISLTHWIDIYPPYELNKKLSLVLNEGTKGKILPAANEDETLVTFLYKYNGWAFLGRVLQNVSKLFNNSDSEKVEFVVNLLNLLTKVVEDNSVDDSKTVLHSMSEYTDDSDILEVILRLFEQSLHSRNIDILEAVLNLLTRLMPFYSYRIWPYLSKSSLLSNNGKEGFASTIFGAIEMVNGEYRITIALIKLTDSLVQNCLSLNEDYPEKSKSAILSKFASHLIFVFESFIYCSFNQSFQKMEVGLLLLDVFSSILAAVYGINEEDTPTKKVTKVLAESSIRILDSFLIPGENYSRATYPIINIIEAAASNYNSYEMSDLSEFWFQNWIRSTLSFSQLAISIRSSLKQRPSAFERLLFKKLPDLVTIYSLHEPLRKDILELITSLTNGNWPNEANPSLLSHLGRDYAQMLLYSLASDLDNSFIDYKLKILVYDFICAVLEGNQEGLSVLFISGRDVFGDFTRNKEEVKVESKPISLLNILKKNVREMKYYPDSVSLHLIDSIALAFNSWTTARESNQDSEFVNELISSLKQIKIRSPDSTEDYVAACYELKLVSKIAETLSLFLFTTKNETCKNSIINLLNSEDFNELLKIHFAIVDYKPSLHANLNLSFENFCNFKLFQFSSALLKRNRFGVTSIYNLGLMDRLLSSKEGWDQLREQIIASSINLQYLNAQIAAAKSFGALVSAYCRKYPTSLDSSYLSLVIYLLKTNVSEGISAEMFRSIYQERLELAFYITYSLYNNHEVKKDSKIVFEIIKVCSELISSPTMSFIQSLTNGSGYYRPLLRILYCTINLIKDESTILIEYFSIFRDLFDLIITRGIKSLLIELQNDVYLSQTNKGYTSTKMNEKIDDLMLILSILKIFVRVKSTPNLHYEMATLLNNSGTIRSLLNLYSFSHMIEVNDEHIFAQLSLMFIQEFMSNDAIAENFISSGLYMILVESEISEPIKKGLLSITASPQYHRIWTNGLLPIFLITLSKLGVNAVPEVCFALQFFGKQIESCIESWSKDSTSIRITSATTSETSQILLLFKLLRSLNATQFLTGSPETIGSEAIDMAVLPGLDSESKRDDFIDCINNLLKHPKFLSSRVSPSSLDERKIMESGDATSNLFVKNLIDEIRDLKDSFA